MKLPNVNKLDDRSFKMDSKTVGNSMFVRFEGTISEAIQLDKLDLNAKTELILDFERITYINSAGVRRWMFWMWNIEKQFKDINFSIDHCSTVMLKQIISVADFVPKNTVIRSFYMPYYCRFCDENSSRLFHVTPVKKVNDGTLAKAISHQNCLNCKATLELDVILEQLSNVIDAYTLE